MVEAKPNNPEARRVALQERLGSFHEEAGRNVSVDETEGAQITFSRHLTGEQLPKTLKAVLFVIGFAPQEIKLSHTFWKNGNGNQDSDIFRVQWEQEETDRKTSEDQHNDPTTARAIFGNWRSGIQSVSISVSGNKEWVKFITDDQGSYVEYDEKFFIKSTNPELFASLKVAHGILADENRKVTLQEDLVSLLDPADPSVTVSTVKKESSSYRRKQADQETEGRVRELEERLRKAAQQILETP